MTNEIIHAGVKGMKWGVRKDRSDSGSSSGSDSSSTTKPTRKELRAKNPDYSQRDRILDATRFGVVGVRRINREMNQGQSYSEARKIAGKKQIRDMLVAGGSYLALAYAPALLSKGYTALKSGAEAKVAADGAAYAASVFSDNRGLTPYTTLSLAFDSVTKTYR